MVNPSDIKTDITATEKKMIPLRQEVNQAFYQSLLMSMEDINSSIGLDNLYGFAIGTGSHFEYFRGMACSKEWVLTNMPYKEAKSIFVEWPTYVNFENFDQVIKILKTMYNLKSELLEKHDYALDVDHYDFSERAVTLNGLVETLAKFREDYKLSDDILLLIGNEDGGDDHVFVRSTSRLNAKDMASIVLTDYGLSL